MKCGHHVPGDSNAFKYFSGIALTKEYTIELLENNTATLKGQEQDALNLSGTWTMVYDQGYMVEFQTLSFLAFSFYHIEFVGKSSVVKHSKCYQTCVGWFMDSTKQKRGCFKGFKLGVNNNLDTFIVNEQNLTETPDIGVNALESSNRVKIINHFDTNHSPNFHSVKVVHRKIEPIAFSQPGVIAPISTVNRVVHINNNPHIFPNHGMIYQPSANVNLNMDPHLIGSNSYVPDPFPHSTLVTAFRFKNSNLIKNKTKNGVKHRLTKLKKHGNKDTVKISLENQNNSWRSFDYISYLKCNQNNDIKTAFYDTLVFMQKKIKNRVEKNLIQSANNNNISDLNNSDKDPNINTINHFDENIFISTKETILYSNNKGKFK